jgi:hypothetical protein
MQASRESHRQPRKRANRARSQPATRYAVCPWIPILLHISITAVATRIISVAQAAEANSPPSLRSIFGMHREKTRTSPRTRTAQSTPARCIRRSGRPAPEPARSAAWRSSPRSRVRHRARAPSSPICAGGFGSASHWRSRYSRCSSGTISAHPQSQHVHPHCDGHWGGVALQRHCSLLP